jgi:3-oxoacyl-[acyl-carrier protein] reductase
MADPAIRTVMITGGSRGVGLGVVRRLSAEGYQVLAIARNPSEALDTAIAEAAANGAGAIHFIPFDLSQIEAIPEMVRQARADFGPLYGLINNAALGTDGLLANMHISQIEALVRVNTVAPIVLTKYAVRAMMAKGEGRVINIASVIGFTGFSGLSVYGATKASMLGFTRSLAREVGRLGVTVNAVAPGFMDTELTQGLGEEGRQQVARRSALRRLVEVEDVAHAVAYLMGPGGRNVTGTVMTVDAGSTA